MNKVTLKVSYMQH